MKIASMKNENPSIANPSPNTPPNVAVKFGHNSPISKLKIVPVITPTANNATNTRDQRRASVRNHGSPVPHPQPLREQHHRWKRDPERDQRDVHRERQRLHLPRLEQILLVDRRECEGERAHAASSRNGGQVDGVRQAATPEGTPDARPCRRPWGESPSVASG